MNRVDISVCRSVNKILDDYMIDNINHDLVVHACGHSRSICIHHRIDEELIGNGTSCNHYTVETGRSMYIDQHVNFIQTKQ